MLMTTPKSFSQEKKVLIILDTFFNSSEPHKGAFLNKNITWNVCITFLKLVDSIKKHFKTILYASCSDLFNIKNNIIEHSNNLLS